MVCWYRAVAPSSLLPVRFPLRRVLPVPLRGSLGGPDEGGGHLTAQDGLARRPLVTAQRGGGVTTLQGGGREY